MQYTVEVRYRAAMRATAIVEASSKREAARIARAAFHLQDVIYTESEHVGPMHVIAVTEDR